MKEPKLGEGRALEKGDDERKKIPMNVPLPGIKAEKKETIAELKTIIANLQTELEENRIEWEQDNIQITDLRKELAQIEKEEEEREKREKNEKERVEKLEIAAEERNRKRDANDEQMRNSLRRAKDSLTKAKENRKKILTNRMAKYGKIGALVARLMGLRDDAATDTVKKMGAPGHDSPDEKITEKNTEKEMKDFYRIKAKTFDKRNKKLAEAKEAEILLKKREEERLANEKIANINTSSSTPEIVVTPPTIAPPPAKVEETPIPKPSGTEEIRAKKQKELEVKFDEKSPESDTIFSNKLATIEAEQNRLSAEEWK
ncbi:MAG TPA: hypothetical protein VK675_00190 [Candidatus Paceibacterota bacterium]|nr:hypothetical protein [Candidatus Paceibacterota bacterium]